MHTNTLSRFIKLIIEAEEIDKIITPRDSTERDIIKHLMKLAKLVKAYDNKLHVSLKRYAYWYDGEALLFRVNKRLAVIVFGTSYSTMKLEYRVRYKFITEKLKKDTHNRLYDVTLDDFLQRIHDASSLENYEKYLYYKDYKNAPVSKHVIDVFEQFIKKFDIDADSLRRDVRVQKTIFDAIIDYKSEKFTVGVGDSKFTFTQRITMIPHDDNKIEIYCRKANMALYGRDASVNGDIDVDMLQRYTKIARTIDEFMVLIDRNKKKLT